jgi:ClpP class serine protease
MVGSIGVYMMHMDYSQALEKEGIAPTFIQAGEYKTESTELKPLTDDAKAHYQSLVDADYKKFVSAVALGRGVSEEKVLKNYGQGRIFNADMAKERKMVDKVGTFNQLLKNLGASAYKRTKNRRKAQALALQMEMATLG